MTSSAVDSNGNVYIAGSTDADILPLAPRSLQTNFNATSCLESSLIVPCRHGFIVKVAADGGVLWSTYLGGTGMDEIRGIALDPSGNVYVAGWTASADFPVTPGAYRTRQGDGFVAGISADGRRLLAATYIGGQANAIAVDTHGAVFVAGFVRTSDFATTPGAFQSTRYTGDADAFVLKLDAALTAPAYSTLLGGSLSDIAYAIQADSAGNAVISGTTASQGAAGGVAFPSTPGAWMVESSFSSDVFVVKLNPTGTAALFASVFGGSGTNYGAALALDSQGFVFVSGSGAPGFPLSPVAYQTSNANGFLTKLSPVGGLVWSTRLPVEPSHPFDGSFHLAVTGSGRVFASGSVIATLQTTPDSLQPCVAYSSAERRAVIGLNEDGSQSVYGAWLDRAVALDPTAALWVPAGTDARILDRVSLVTPLSPRVTCVSNAASFFSGPVAPGEVVSLFGPAIGPAEAAFARLDSSGRLATELAGTQVFVNGQPAPLLYAGPTQINAVVPFGLAGSQASFAVRTGGMDLPVLTTPVAEASPAVFAHGVLNQDNTPNSASNPAKAGSVIQIWGTGAGLMDPVPADGDFGTASARIRSLVRLIGQIPAGCFMGGCVPQYLHFEEPAYYAGDAPGIVQGVFQIDARISPGFILSDLARRDGVAVTIRVGSITSPAFPIWVSAE